ncbi:hypothetical protein QBC38DRAFT_483517 [Podospora fimiseda]|uniref:3'(2'),5'-bisphosphate nucleotidase n=1 Tax=Podospora fimiseda TaxID=252190 RepID=A0AAN7GYN4_9PEZI|nr:hypothetical protein QBC38DRAFT_483517 [Podospora fimiseda]
MSRPNNPPKPPHPLKGSGSSHLSHERLIAQLAVQRASLLTKRVQQTLDLPSTSPIPSTPLTPTGSSIPWYLNSASASAQTHNNGRRCSVAKPDASPVTIADFAAQALLISAIHSAFPEDSFVGEEDSYSLRADTDLTLQVWELICATKLDDEKSESLLARPKDIEEMFRVIDLGGKGKGGRKGRFWALDPIDGTSAFLKGQQYAISLALIEDGQEVLGVLGCPNLPSPSDGQRVEENRTDGQGMGVMISAVKGDGYAVLREMGSGGLKEGRRIDKRRDHSKGVELKDLHFVDSLISPATSSDKVHELALKAGAKYPGTEVYSSHMRYAAMVLGGREYVQARIPYNKGAAWCLWDHAGSQLIYKESGTGKVTDLYGKEIYFGTGRKLTGNWGLITADESVHGKVQGLVTELLAKSSD